MAVEVKAAAKSENDLVQDIVNGEFDTIVSENEISALDKETFVYLREDRVIQDQLEKVIQEQAQTFTNPEFIAPWYK